MYVFHFFFSNCNVLKMGIFDHETTKQAYRDGLVVYLSFSSHNIYIYMYMYIYICIYIYIYVAIGEKNRETILSSLQACFVIVGL